MKMERDMDAESSDYDASDYESEEKEEHGKAFDAKNTREARIASILDVLQEIEDEDPTLMKEARERRRAAKIKVRPPRPQKTVKWNDFNEKDSYVHRPLNPGRNPSKHGNLGFSHSPLPSASYGGTVFSSMTGMLPMGVTPEGSNYPYGPSDGVGGSGPYFGYPGMPSTSIYDGLASRGTPKPYKEGGATIKFDTFDGAKNKKKTMLFIQQFDAAFSGGNYMEISKIH